MERFGNGAMKVGVTGGAGFIGGWVADILKARHHEVVVFDTRGRRPREDVDLMLGDIRDEVAVTELAAHVDAIIHLAAVLGTQETIRNPRPAVMTNALGGLNVLEACDQYKLPLVNICVGNWWMNNSYSITKNTFERLLAMFIEEHGLAAANVRCVNAYGPRQAAAPPFAAGKVRKILPAFACRALSDMPIEVYGDGSQVSDCVYVADVARTLVTALEFVAEGGVVPETIEVGPLTSNSVNDVAKMVAKAASQVTGKPPVSVTHLPMRPGEIPGAVVTADTSTLAQVGVDPTTFVSLEPGIKATVDYFDRSEGTTWNKP
jgi:UDP-glucose 4-epimerase